ncbi:hypothetical protein GNI_050860 [Gregarina niphandrodes]|uniref:Uncharacterized protein n=1 Tax=Gregarina niphandrodes TaxID=110365 RepID=A0A023B9E2_GRENI|nr:hypothetical protein GNI_050860 [Gregarina niphandrodes]EZG72701.1 hypothetical protein GNI_050860 [Gregarina niphandrodes]|eukprot:XP_011129759.1 hypothetical protein GNI_050860 [Gregarina niphandrodes]
MFPSAKRKLAERVDEEHDQDLDATHINNRPFAVRFVAISQNLFQLPPRDEFLVKDDDIPVDDLLKRDGGLYEHRKTKKLYVPTRLRSKLTAWYHGPRGSYSTSYKSALPASAIPVRGLPRAQEDKLKQPFFMSRVSVDYVGPGAFQGQE